jgi:hypothetical protein
MKKRARLPTSKNKKEDNYRERGRELWEVGKIKGEMNMIKFVT